MHRKISASETRTLEQLQVSYEIEKKLAAKLRNSTQEERKRLYSSVYDEFFRQVPYDPLLTRKANAQMQGQYIADQILVLRRFLTQQITYLEIGAGDCSLACEIAKSVDKVYAVEVSEEISRQKALPPNIELVISDGISVPVPSHSINLAYSNNVMEHLHPDDAFDQLRNIHDTLATGGIYLCVTPNRTSGPHDTSKYFDNVSSGFHLKEYTIRELVHVFEKAGFSKVQTIVGGRGRYLLLPPFPGIWFESILSRMLPIAFRQRVADWKFSRAVLGIILIGIK